MNDGALVRWLAACCLAWVLGGAGRAGEGGVFAELQASTFSGLQGHVPLRFKIYTSGKEFARGTALRCASLRLKWTRSAADVLVLDAPLDPPLKLRWGSEAVCAIDATGFLPAKSGMFALEVQPVLSVDKDVPLAPDDPRELRAIAVQSVIRCAVTERDAKGKGVRKDEGVVILDGSASEPKESITGYQWVQTKGTPLEMPPEALNRRMIRMLLYTQDVYGFSLKVMNGKLTSEPADVIVLAGEPREVFTIRRNPKAMLWLIGAELVLLVLIGFLLRRRIRFHLSTSVAAALTAGGMLALNARESFTFGSAGRISASPGWPMPILEPALFEDLSVIGLGVDALIFLAVVGAAGVGWEWVTGRRR